MKLFSRLTKVIKVRKEGYKNKTENIKSFNLGGAAIANFKCTFEDILSINKAGVLFNTAIISEHFFIAIENLTNAEFKTDVELSKDVTSNNKHTVFDVLALSKEPRPFLIITYIKNGLEAKKTIECKLASDAVKEITTARSLYLNERPEALSINTSDRSAPTTNTQSYQFSNTAIPKSNKDSTQDILELIDKLFKLKEQGIITTKEFNEKKKDLLKRI